MAMFALLPFGTSIFSGSFSLKSWAVMKLQAATGCGHNIRDYRIKLMRRPDYFLLSS